MVSLLRDYTELTSVRRTVNPSPASLVVPHAVISAPVPAVDSEVVVSEDPQVQVVVAARFMSQTFVPFFFLLPPPPLR